MDIGTTREDPVGFETNITKIKNFMETVTLYLDSIDANKQKNTTSRDGECGFTDRCNVFNSNWDAAANIPHYCPIYFDNINNLGPKKNYTFAYCLPTN